MLVETADEVKHGVMERALNSQHTRFRHGRVADTCAQDRSLAAQEILYFVKSFVKSPFLDGRSAKVNNDMVQKP